MTVLSYFSGGDVNKPYGEAVKSNTQSFFTYDPNDNDGKPISQGVIPYKHKAYGSHIPRSHFVVGDRYISAEEGFLQVLVQQSPNGKLNAGDSVIVQHIGPKGRLGLTYIDIKKPIPDGIKFTVSFKPCDPSYDDFKRDDRVIKSNSPMSDRKIWPNNVSDFTESGLFIIITIDVDKDTQPASTGKEDTPSTPAIIPVGNICFGIRQEVTAFSTQENCLCYVPPCDTKFKMPDCIPNQTYDASGYTEGCESGGDKS
ncbi:MAG: hypothetical protein [Caudoviricetes sp.]|nr:MAG: hypothetical protein [Caudoviricetes sp.]